MRTVAGVCFAVLALAACGKPADKPAPAAAAAAKSPVPPGIEAAPHLKAGLWEITVGDTPMKASSCIDDATQNDGAALGQSLDRRDCTKSTWTRIPGGVAFELDCVTEGMHMTSKGTVTGDFNSAYRMESDVTGSRDGQSFTHKQVIDAKYMGACPKGMNPGDKQITVNGRTMVLPGGRAPG
jgi:hypothetical protein